MDYKEIIDRITPEQIKNLLLSLGAEEIIEKDNFFITNTICHNISGGSLKLYYYFDNHLFYCFTEDGGMSPINFLQHYYETRGIKKTFSEILSMLNSGDIDEENFIVAYKKRNKREKKKEIILNEYRSNILNVFTKNYPIEWLEEGISKQTMDKYNILYSISQNKIIIPHYDINGRLIGIRGRALNEEDIVEGKYKPVTIEGITYSHPLSLNLYGLNFNKNDIDKTNQVILFESEKSVMLMDSYFGINNSVAVCGSNFNKNQLLLLLKYCKIKEIVIAFDKEYGKVGDSEFSKYISKLRAIGEKYNKYCNIYYIADKEGRLDKKDSPIDKGPDTFQYLLNKKMLIRN